MATTDNPTLHRLYDAITVGSKRFSGIVGDARHAASGGYHIGRAFVPSSDYSAGQGGRNASPRDDRGDADIACAIDVSLSTADMIAVTKRLLAACGTPALRGVREFNGTVDGRTTLNRDAVLGWRQNYVPDATHLWHIHIGFFRDTAQDWDTLADVAAVINGTPVHPASNSATNLDGTDLNTKALTVQEDDMYMVALDDRDGKGYVGNGITRRWLTSEADRQDTLAKLGAAGLKNPDTGQTFSPDDGEKLQRYANIGVLGVLVGGTE